MIGQVPLQMLIPHTDTVSQTQQMANQRASVEHAQAAQTMKQQVKQARDTVVPKDTLQLHDYRYDASKEGNQKYQDRRKKQNRESEADEQEKQHEPESRIPRVNFNVQV